MVVEEILDAHREDELTDAKELIGLLPKQERDAAAMFLKVHQDRISRPLISMTLRSAEVLARALLSKIRPQDLPSSLNATLNIVDDVYNAGDRGAEYSRMDALANWFLDSPPETAARDPLFPLMPAQAFAFMTIYLAVSRDEAESLKAAYWMSWYAVEHHELRAAKLRAMRASSAARHRRPSRQKVDDVRLTIEVEILQKSKIQKRNWVSVIGRRLADAGYSISDVGLRNRLKRLYPKIFLT